MNDFDSSLSLINNKYFLSENPYSTQNLQILYQLFQYYNVLYTSKPNSFYIHEPSLQYSVLEPNLIILRNYLLCFFWFNNLFSMDSSPPIISSISLIERLSPLPMLITSINNLDCDLVYLKLTSPT